MANSPANASKKMETAKTSSKKKNKKLLERLADLHSTL